MTEPRQREWLVTFQPRWDRLEVREEVVRAPRWWDVSAALYKLHPWSVIRGVWAVLDDWPTDEELEEAIWQPIETAPRDGSLIELKREVDGGTLFQERGFYGIMAKDAPSRIPLPPDPLGRDFLEKSILRGSSFPDSPRWLREGGRYCFPEPTHWRPLQEGDEEL